MAVGSKSLTIPLATAVTSIQTEFTAVLFCLPKTDHPARQSQKRRSFRRVDRNDPQAIDDAYRESLEGIGRPPIVTGLLPDDDSLSHNAQMIERSVRVSVD